MQSVNFTGEPLWQQNEHTCALSDAERHLAQVFEDAGLWTAFDATHPARTKDGLKQLGVFSSFEDARLAVEAALGKFSRPAIRSAGA